MKTRIYAAAAVKGLKYICNTFINKHKLFLVRNGKEQHDMDHLLTSPPIIICGW